MRTRRIIRSALVVAAFAVASAGVAVPANAATQMTAMVGINQNGTGTNKYNNAWINVNLPMNRYDAQGYINNGARIEIDCWGEDSVVDDYLFTNSASQHVYTGAGSGVAHLPGAEVYVTGVNRLTADDYGVHLTALISRKYAHGPADKFYSDGFNEDYSLFDKQDEVYCKATWRDGDGHKLAARTNTTLGYY